MPGVCVYNVMLCFKKIMLCHEPADMKSPIKNYAL